MRAPDLEMLDMLVGDWSLTLLDTWFLESRDIQKHGHISIRWLGEAFLELEAELEGEPMWHFVIGRTDATDELVATYHDPRPTSRLFRMTFAHGEWTLWREDPDLYQRFAATITPDWIDGQWIDGQWLASEDKGALAALDDTATAHLLRNPFRLGVSSTNPGARVRREG